MSVVLHILVLLLSPVFIRVGLPPGHPDHASQREDRQGMQVVRVVPSADPALDAEEAIWDEPSRDPARAPDAPATVPSPRTPAAPGTSPVEGAAEEAADSPLRPGLRDPRLWVTPGEHPLPEREPTHEELHARYMAHLEARLRAWNDSIAGDAERARRATDWTTTDGQGRRWGVSPDGIHLGDVTLPPTTFTPGGGDPDRRRRAEEQDRIRREIDRQETDAERRRAQREAAERTRERRDAERGGD